MTVRLTYRDGRLGVGALRNGISEELANLVADGSATPGFGETDSPDSIRVAPASAHFDPELLVVAVTFGSEVALDCWRKLILPRLEARFGRDAIGEESPEEDDNDR